MCRFGFRFWRGPAKQSPAQVVLYTRAGCHLCDDAWNLLHQARQRLHFVLEIVDVDTDAALRAQHGERVPVVEINGRVRCWGRINKVLLERQLRTRNWSEPEA
jgi:glutaredoxin